MGHIKMLEPDGERRRTVDAEVRQDRTTIRKVRPTSEPIFEEIIIEDQDEGEVELSWDDIEKMELLPSQASATSTLGERLYGTLTTKAGEEYSGCVCWDMDETMTDDVLEGETRDRSRKIKFDKIASLERYSASACEVTLKSGESVVMRGTNDVDDSNRGITISDPAFGDITVDWNEFDKLEFKPAPMQISYSQFDGGRPIHGTVYAEDGGDLHRDNSVG